MRDFLQRTSRVLRGIGVVWLGLLLVGVGPVAGQAVCSAPHSSPTLAQSGSIGTLPPGSGWLQLSFYGQDATTAFSPDGTPTPFLADARFRTRSLFLTGALGVVEGLEIWAQLPMHRLAIDGSGGESRSSGVGDVRVAARVSGEIAGWDLPAALRLGVKIPGSGFPVDATVLPLTEGQRDVELSLEGGRTIGDSPLYVFGWVGYRWRSENTAAERLPGAERYAHVAIGAAGDLWSWEVAADGLWGAAPRVQRILLSGERRRLVQLLPTVGYGVGPGRLELTGQVSLVGRNLPRAHGVSAGYRVLWGG